MEAYTATEQVYPRTDALITKNWPYITKSWPPCNKELDLRNLDHRYIWSIHVCVSHRCLVAEICSWEARACKLTEISIGQRDATYTVSISSFSIPAFRPKQG